MDFNLSPINSQFSVARAKTVGPAPDKQVPSNPKGRHDRLESVYL